MQKRIMTITCAPGFLAYKQQKPMIRITNWFMVKAGFRVGDPVEVIYQRNVITIMKIKVKNDQEQQNPRH